MTKENLTAVNNAPIESGKDSVTEDKVIKSPARKLSALPRSKEILEKETSQQEKLKKDLVEIFTQTNIQSASPTTKEPALENNIFESQAHREFEEEWQREKPTIDTGNRVVRKWRNKLVAALGFISMAMPNLAKGSEGEKDGKTKKEIVSMERVVEVPLDAVFVRKEGNKNIYKKVEGELKMAQKAIKNAKSDPNYEKFLEGKDPYELAAKGYISKDQIPKYLKSYNSNAKFFYTEDFDKGVPIPTPHIVEINPHIEMTPKEGKIFKLNAYKKLYILFDDSPSMEYSKAHLASDLKENESDVPVDISGFTSKIDTTFTTSNPKEASQALAGIKLVNDQNEFALDVAITKLQTIQNDEGKKLMVICTDEELQKVNQENLESLRKLASDKNVDIEFSIKNKDDLYKFSLADIQSAYQKIYEQKIKPTLQAIQRDIVAAETQIEEMRAKQSVTTKAKEKSQINEAIVSNEGFIARRQQNLKDAVTVNIANFSEIVSAKTKASYNEGLAKNK